ncbi:hypothetical protein ABK040_011039 [Willaertia magna]
MNRKLQTFIQFDTLENAVNYITNPTPVGDLFPKFTIQLDFKYHNRDRKTLISRKQIVITKFIKVNDPSFDIFDFKQFTPSLNITTAAHYENQVYISKCVALEFKLGNVLKTKSTLEELKMDKNNNVFENSPLYNANTSHNHLNKKETHSDYY